MNRVPSPVYTLSADMFDYTQGTMTADVAALDVPEDYDSERYHFYCSACARQEHYTRLKVVKEQSQPKSKFNAPRRYNLFDHKDSVHVCEEAARFRELDADAFRYNARRFGDYKYQFSDRLPMHQTLVEIKGKAKTVDRARRLANVAFSLIYDQDLMARQKLSLGGSFKEFRDGFFDASAEDKRRIFLEALKQTSAQTPFMAAAIFQPNRNPEVIKDYERRNCLVGTFGPDVDHGNGVSRPINLLTCGRSEIYAEVKKVADRNGSGPSNMPLVVMGEVYLTTDEEQGIQRPPPETETDVSTVYTAFRVRSAKQVAKWNHDIKFNDAATNQNKIQRDRAADMALAIQQSEENRQKAFAL